MIRDLRAVQRLGAKALSNGARRTGITTIEWDVSGDCQHPKWVEVIGRPSGRNPQYVGWSWRRALAGSGFDPRIQLDGLTEFGYSYDQMVDRRLSAFRELEPMPDPETRTVVIGPEASSSPLSVLMETRCRGCAACLERRRKLWTARSRAELLAAHRSWFGTLTLRADEHYRLFCAALADARLREGEADKLTPEETFALRCKSVTPETTKYLKRIRKESGARIKYLLVTEAHESGLPHFHMLVHEVTRDLQVRKRTLEGQWNLGFSQWRLIDPEADMRRATYLCKYLSKSVSARVRASIAYGITDGSPDFPCKIGAIDSNGGKDAHASARADAPHT